MFILVVCLFVLVRNPGRGLGRALGKAAGIACGVESDAMGNLKSGRELPTGALQVMQPT